MWSALENIALRESLPSPLKVGQSIHDILIAGQLNRGRFNLHYQGQRRSQPFLLKQFYSIDANAFLRWQNEARFIGVPQTEGFIWPFEEWRGGLVSPFPEGMPLDAWLDGDTHTLETRLLVATTLARQIARIHASGIAHRGLSPSCIRISEKELSISDFGYAHCREWDDFWTDSFLKPGNTTCTSPECMKGTPGIYGEDVYAFGCILHLILSGKNAFGTFKSRLRTLAPWYVSPDTLPQDLDVPYELRELETACLDADHTRRPSMNTIASTLGRLCGLNDAHGKPFLVPVNNATVSDKQKVMVFVQEAEHAIGLIEDALRTAKHTPSVILFVGLIPNNLPSGHIERFKGSLFRKLGQGLARFRASDLPWSLRILENVDQAKAKEALIGQYQPDTQL